MSADLDVLWVSAIGAFLLVALVMPGVLKAWEALGRRDDEVSLRKVHAGEIPRAGGLVVIFGFGVMLLVGLAGTTELSATHQLFSITPLTGGLVGALICGLTGLYDDLVGLRPRYKLLLQMVAALIAVLFGVHWPALELLLGWSLHPLATVLTFVFLLGAVNAINLMDGLDGLAGGIVFIGFAVVVAAAAGGGAVVASVPVAWIAAAALGATGGFLMYNRHPAKVFLGDAGSHFLGFLLAVVLLQVSPVRWRVAPIQLSIPLLVLALPLFDTALAISRRVLRGQSIFTSDSDHIHHRLLAAGLSHGRAVLVLWICSAMFATLAYLNIVGVGGWWTLLGTLLAMLVAAVLLGYHRLLGQLPAFSGERRAVGWRDRRREVMEALVAVSKLADGPDDRGPQRWKRLGPDIAPLLERLGVPAFEIRRGETILESFGDAASSWAWLGIPLPGSGGAEVRLALSVRLPQLQQEQLTLLEKVVELLAAAPAGRRQSRDEAPSAKPAPPLAAEEPVAD